MLTIAVVTIYHRIMYKEPKYEYSVITHLNFLKHGTNMAPQLRRFQCIDVEPILLGSGGDVYAIANLLAQHGHSELKDLTVTPQVFITITTKLIPWLI